MVYYSQYGIVSMMLRKTRDKVHCNLLKGEGSFFCRNAVKGYFCLVSKDFVLLAGCASLDVVCYPLAHSCPG